MKDMSGPDVPLVLPGNKVYLLVPFQKSPHIRLHQRQLTLTDREAISTAQSRQFKSMFHVKHHLMSAIISTETSAAVTPLMRIA